MVSSYTKNIYFKEIQNKSILTKTEQLNLAKQITELKVKLGKTKKATENDIIEEHIRRIRDKLVESCYLMVVKIAKKYHNRYLSLFDLIEEGNLALLSAIDTFDYKKNIKFSTFATIVVKNRILTAISHRGRTVKISQDNRISLPSYGNPRFVHASSGSPTPFRTFTKQIGVDSSKMHRVIQDLQHNVEYEQRLAQELFDEILINEENEKNSPEPTLIKNNLLDNLSKISKILTKQEHEIIVCYYGLKREPERFNVIGKRMKLSSERVRQIHNQAMDKIKNSKLNPMLSDYLFD